METSLADGYTRRIGIQRVNERTDFSKLHVEGHVRCRMHLRACEDDVKRPDPPKDAQKVLTFQIKDPEDGCVIDVDAYDTWADHLSGIKKEDYVLIRMPFIRYNMFRCVKNSSTSEMLGPLKSDHRYRIVLAPPHVKGESTKSVVWHTTNVSEAPRRIPPHSPLLPMDGTLQERSTNSQSDSTTASIAANAEREKTKRKRAPASVTTKGKGRHDKAKRKKKGRAYQYKGLKDLGLLHVEKKNFNFFGVVVGLSLPIATSGTDHVMRIKLIDPSLLSSRNLVACADAVSGHSVEVTVFAPIRPWGFPATFSVGDIVRVHRACMYSSNIVIQSRRSSVVVIDVVSEEKRTTSKSFEWTDENDRKVEMLRKWSKNVLTRNALPGDRYLRTISDVSHLNVFDYVDLLCCVTKICRGADRREVGNDPVNAGNQDFFFDVCDGSGVARMHISRFSLETRLPFLAAVKVGWYIRLRNVMKRENSGDGRVHLEFRDKSHLFRVPDFSLSLASHISPALMPAVMRELRASSSSSLTTKTKGSSEQSVASSKATSTTTSVPHVGSKAIEGFPSVDGNYADAASRNTSPVAWHPQCPHPIFRTRTLVCASIPPTPLNQIVRSSSNGASLPTSSNASDDAPVSVRPFRCWVRATAVVPRNVRDMCRRRDGDQDEYEFALALRLEDMSGALMAWFVGKQASTFFGTRPANLRTDHRAAARIRTHMECILTPGVWFECCLLRCDYSGDRKSLFYAFGVTSELNGTSADETLAGCS